MNADMKLGEREKQRNNTVMDKKKTAGERSELLLLNQHIS